MDIAALWPIAKIMGVFFLTLGLMRAGIGLGSAILGGSLVLALAFGLSPAGWIGAVLAAVTQQKLMLLAAVVGLILVLSDSLERTGQSRRLMEELARFLRWPRLRLVFFPALIGLLPMPGGAIFSCPMVRDAAQGLPVAAERKAMLNYWFRHIWELTWPLYPGIILASYLSDIPLGRLILHTWPSLAVSLVLGWIFFLRPKVLPLPAAEPPAGGESAPRALLESLPLIVSLAGAAIFGGVLASLWPEVPSEWGFILSLSLAIGVCSRQNRLGWREVLGLFLQVHVLKMLYLVLAIFVFKEVMDQGGVVEEIGRFATGRATLLAAAVILPFIGGLVSGITMAFVGATFPLILGLVGQLGLEAEKLPIVVLALFSGYTGILVSPLHVCLLLTLEYFHVDMAQGWRRTVLPSVLFLLFAFAWFLVLLRLYA